MNALYRFLDKSLQWIVILLMVVLTAVVIAGVLFRKFGHSLIWYDEVASVLLAWVTYYGAAFAALRRGHIGVDSVLLRLPRSFRIPLVFLAEVLVIGFFVGLGYSGYLVLMSLHGDMLVSLPWVPVAFTQSVIPIGAALFVICELVSFPRYLHAMREGTSMSRDEPVESATPGSSADPAGTVSSSQPPSSSAKA